MFSFQLYVFYFSASFHALVAHSVLCPDSIVNLKTRWNILGSYYFTLTFEFLNKSSRSVFIFLCLYYLDLLCIFGTKKIFNYFFFILVIVLLFCLAVKWDLRDDKTEKTVEDKMKDELKPLKSPQQERWLYQYQKIINLIDIK